MKRYALWVKCLVFFLAVVLALGVAVGALGVLMTESMNMYTRDAYEDWLYDRYRDRALSIAHQVLMDYGSSLSDCPDWLLEQTGHADAIANVASWYELGESDWCYTIKNAAGRTIRNTYSENFAKDALCFIFELDTHYPMQGGESDHWEAFLNPETDEILRIYYQYETGFQVTVYLDRNHTGYKVNNLSQAMLMTLFDLRYTLIAVIGVSLLLFAVTFIYLLSAAGRDARTGDVSPKALNRLPLDLYLCAAVGISVLGCVCVVELMDMLFYDSGYNILILVLLCGCGVIVATTDIGFFLAVAAQFKLTGGFWWRHSICGRVLKVVWKYLKIGFGYIGKGFRFAGRGINSIFGMLPIIWEWIVAGGILGILLVIICAGSTAHWYTVVPMVMWCLTFALIVTYCGYCFGTIRKGIKRMNEGNLYEKINTEWMYGSFKTIGEELNSLADVVIIAAEKQLKSERMKTELITNVSHDIKTPLTSVINYVDLLQQPHTEEEGMQYLEVLSRQSLRLKKLVEDLMDMSKASTGNVVVNAQPMDAVETVNQALGEFSDKLEAAKLTPVFRASMPQMSMLADGRLTWRVLSNLLGNVVKYALPGTRVYLDLTRQDKQVILSVKNISREELNITAEELTERFVRGDASRNTEGSGLGLNIAQSLMRLQRGSLELTVDGDLFKVTLTFPTE